MNDFRIALAASPREWAQRLHRHVADHGGAIVRATVMHSEDALDETYDVLLADDTTSFLTRGLVVELHARGRAVLGVYDPEDPRAKGELIEAGVDDVIERDAAPDAFLAAVAALAVRRAVDRDFVALVADLDDRDEAPTRGPGRIVVVGGAAGGVGATEIAIGLAAASGRRGQRCVLVDADDVAPALAQRLGLAPYPNLRTAVEAVTRDNGALADVPVPLPGLPVAALPGLASGRDWQQVRPAEVLDAVRELAALGGQAVVNVGHRLEDLPAAGGPPRYALARGLLGLADAVVGVGLPAPVGVARLIDWVAAVRVLTSPGAALHLVCNLAPASAFVRSEVTAELSAVCLPDGVWMVPGDGRVAAAAWAGALVRRGPFTRALDALADATCGAVAQRRRRRPLARWAAR